MARGNGRAKRAGFLIIDLFASVGIYLLGLMLGTLVLLLVFMVWRGIGISEIEGWARVVWRAWGTTFSPLLEGAMFFVDEPDLNNVLGVFFVTTMFTSIWAWAYVIGARLWPFLTFLRKAFDCEKHPVGAAMTIGGMVVGAVVVVIAIVSMVLRFG